jgi:hypothetical protein
MYSGASVVNNGYYDVPICDKYSNKEQPRTIKYTDEYNVNQKINLNINNNKEEYIVDGIPTYPSASLYYETDKPSSSYYNSKYVNTYYNAIEQFDNNNQNNNNKTKIFVILLIIFILCFFLFASK